MKPNLLFATDGSEWSQMPWAHDMQGAAATYAPKGRDLGVLRQADCRSPAASAHKDLIRDLNLDTVFHTMADGDDYLFETVRQLVPELLSNAEAIRYRQEVLKDALRNASVVKTLYRFASDAVEGAIVYRDANQPGYAQMVPMSEKLQHAVGLLDFLLERAAGLKILTSRSSHLFISNGMKAFCERVDTEFSEAFLGEAVAKVADLKSLSAEGRMVLASRLGVGLKGTAHVFRRILCGSTYGNSSAGAPGGVSGGNVEARGIRRFRDRTVQHDGVILLENIHLTKGAAEMEEAGLVLLLRLVNRLAEELFRFFSLIRFETGFYVGCIHFHDALLGAGVPVCFPEPAGEPAVLSFHRLVDAGLALQNGKCPVANRLESEGRHLFLVTGANQGGKSTFLRSIGLAQVFLQCGMFVSAEQFRSSLKDRLFTFFSREEDAALASGRLEAEMARMDGIVGKLTGRSMLLMNEAFATTTEQAGAQIASDLVHALCEAGISVLFVTHLFEFADRMHAEGREDVLFLRAERLADGRRSFRMEEGAPLETSYGDDLFSEWVSA